MPFFPYLDVLTVEKNSLCSVVGIESKRQAGLDNDISEEGSERLIEVAGKFPWIQICWSVATQAADVCRCLA